MKKKVLIGIAAAALVGIVFVSRHNICAGPVCYSGERLWGIPQEPTESDIRQFCDHAKYKVRVPSVVDIDQLAKEYGQKRADSFKLGWTTVAEASHFDESVVGIMCPTAVETFLKQDGWTPPTYELEDEYFVIF